MTPHSSHQSSRHGSPFSSRPHTPNHDNTQNLHHHHHHSTKRHGLHKHSARHSSSQLCDTYVGLSFRLYERGSSDLEAYVKEHLSNGGEGIGHFKLEKGQALLVWGAVLSDGVGQIDTGSDSMIVDLGDGQAEGKDDWKEVKRVAERICNDALEVSRGRSMVIQVVAVSEPLPLPLKNCPIFLPTLWMHLNAIPFLVPSPFMMFADLPDPLPEYFASTAVAEAIKHLHPAIHSAVTVQLDEKTHRVKVDADGMIQTASIEGYRQSTSPELWRRFMALVRHVKGNDIRFVRCSATPQGGGVALLQHALVRLLRCVGLGDHVTWHVPEGHVSVFDITKKKFHNVLQGVAKSDVKLEEMDRKYFEIWTKANYEQFWKETGVFEGGKIVVIDDPQLTALIPLLRRDHPSSPIIFRSHIQIQSDLVDDPKTEQHAVWNYHFDFVKHVDLFLAHPVDFFVPQNVKETLPVLYMPPSTDPLDGLNKPLGSQAVEQLRQVYNHLSETQCGITVDWTRGYILQVARFDPSKGLPVLVESYLKFRQQLEAQGKGTDPSGKKPPMLIVVGHGSVDDPDGSSQYEMLHEQVNSPGYELVRDDVSIVRAPPSDTLLGMLMQGAWCATQLSTREGFEVKVSEAVLKRIPIIASKAGGIPLQVKDGLNGWIVPPSDSNAVANVLVEFYLGKKKLDRAAGRPDERERMQDTLSKDGDMNGKIGDDDFLRQAVPEISTEGESGTIGYGEATHPSKTDARHASEMMLDPNTSAENFVRNVGAPFPAVHPDGAAPSEDFFTVGNASRWLLILSLMSGKPIRRSHHERDEVIDGEADSDGEVELLKSMGLSEQGTPGGKSELMKVNGQNVYRMLMTEKHLEEQEAKVIQRNEM